MNRRISIAVLSFAMVFAILSCQSPTGGTDNSLSPPDWIIGTWSDEYGINTYQFTDNNVIFCLDAAGVITTVDFMAFYRGYGIVETGAEATYSLTLSTAADTTVYQFLDNGDATLDYSIATGGVSTGPIVLIRK